MCSSTYEALLMKSLENLQSKKFSIRKPSESRLAQSKQFDSFILGHGALWEHRGQVPICPAAWETNDAFLIQWVQEQNQKLLFNSGELPLNSSSKLLRTWAKYSRVSGRTAHHSHVEVAHYTLHSCPLASASTGQLLSTQPHLPTHPPLQQAHLHLSCFGYRSPGLGAWTPVWSILQQKRLCQCACIDRCQGCWGPS